MNKKSIVRIAIVALFAACCLEVVASDYTIYNSNCVASLWYKGTASVDKYASTGVWMNYCWDIHVNGSVAPCPLGGPATSFTLYDGSWDKTNDYGETRTYEYSWYDVQTQLVCEL